MAHEGKHFGTSATRVVIVEFGSNTSRQHCSLAVETYHRGEATPMIDISAYTGMTTGGTTT
jgi:hypothetical protein